LFLLCDITAPEGRFRCRDTTQQVDHYLRQAKAARELAGASNSDLIRVQFEKVAQAWETLAKERLALLQLQIDKLGGDAVLMVAQSPERPSPPDGSQA
jgi:hypothetical protein